MANLLAMVDSRATSMAEHFMSMCYIPEAPRRSTTPRSIFFRGVFQLSGRWLMSEVRDYAHRHALGGQTMRCMRDKLQLGGCTDAVILIDCFTVELRTPRTPSGNKCITLPLGLSTVSQQFQQHVSIVTEIHGLQR